jgi:hypothetical protein
MTRVLLCVLLLAGACVTQRSAKGKSVVEADAAAVAGCSAVGQVIGSSPVPATGHENAKTDAVNVAGELGATNVVWRDTYQNGDRYFASGIAYRCGG